MKSYVVTLLCAALLFLAAGCGTKPAATPSPTKEPAPVEGQETPVQGEAAPVQGDAAQGSDARDDRVIEEPSLGLRFRLPDVWYRAMYEQPCILPSSYLHGMALDYISAEGFAALNRLFTEQIAQDAPERKDLEAASAKGLVPLCALAAENEGERDEELRARYPVAHELGTQNGTTYTLLTNPDADLSALTDAERETYRALLAATADFAKDMTLSGKPEAFQGDSVSFASKTIDGKDIASQSAFAENRLTMINIWATWCGPCINELPELQKLSERLPEGVDLLGICTDGEQEPELAAQILEKTGVRYPNAVANADMMAGFLSGVQAYPTTLFVDAQGNIVGDPMPGVPSGDVVEGYLKAIEERLAQVEAGR